MAGEAVVPEDDDLGDALFLDAHPGWTWETLQRTPEAVLLNMRALALARAGRKQQQEHLDELVMQARTVRELARAGRSVTH
jgi:hypothetical protein